MANITYQHSGLGTLGTGLQTSWSQVHSQATGSIPGGALEPEIRVRVSTGRGGAAFQIYRSFVYFNTGFPALGTITAASITYSSVGVSAQAMATYTVVESNAFLNGTGALQLSDFSSLPNTNVTFCGPFQWAPNGSIATATFNAAGISYLNSTQPAVMATLNENYDQPNTTPPTFFSIDFAAQIAQGSSSTVELNITYTPNPINEINTAAFSTINEINTVARSTISEVNTV